MHPQANNIGAYIKPVFGLKPQESAAATVTGPVIDRQGFRSCSLVGLTGTATGSPTAQSSIFKIQHGDASNLSDAADFTGGALAAITADETGGELEVNLSGAKRYIRVAAVISFTAGTTPKQLVAAAVVLGGAQTLPA